MNKYTSPVQNQSNGATIVELVGKSGNSVDGLLDNYNILKASPVAFTGGTANTRGDSGGTLDPLTLYTVTGDVLLGVYGVCTLDLVSAGAGSLSVGPVGNTALMIPAKLATTIDVNQVVMNTTPAIGQLMDDLKFYIVGNGVDIVEDITTADITAGQIYYICLWRALSPGSTVT